MRHPFPADPSLPVIDADGDNPRCGCPLHTLTVPSPCDTFVSAGFGAMGDYEHSTFCSSCGWEFADHTCSHPAAQVFDAWCYECGDNVTANDEN